MPKSSAASGKPAVISKTQRWLDLIAYLAGRRYPVPVEDLMQALPAYAPHWQTGASKDRESARRVFERDKQELRAAGIPIEAVKHRFAGGLGETDGYLLAARDFYLPYLKLVAGVPARPGGSASSYPEPSRPAEVALAETEARDALEALRRVAEVPGSPLAEEARSAYAKLAFDLDPITLGGPEPLAYAAVRDAADPATLRLLADALHERRRVRFQYHAIRRDEVSERTAEPYGLLFAGGHWYLAARDPGRDGIREFRVGRMREASLEGAAEAFTVPEGFRLAERAERQAWELGDEAPLTARVRFHFPLSLWAERNRMGEAEAAAHDRGSEELTATPAAGAAVRTFTVRQADPFVRWLLTLGGEAELLGPTELKREYQRVVGEVAALYAGPPAHRAAAHQATGPAAGPATGPDAVH